MFGININLGGLAEKICDSIGLPESFGDIASMAVNYQTGNYFGMAEDAMDLCEDTTAPRDEEPYASYDSPFSYVSTYESPTTETVRVSAKTTGLVDDGVDDLE